MAFLAKKSLGQHFLVNPHVPELMADAGGVVAGDTVLEIGPGTGALTRVLLSRGASVVAIEADGRAISVLEETFPEEITDERLVLHHGDARTIDPAALGLAPYTYKLIANIPYYLSGMLFRTFLAEDCAPSTLVFLVQKEIAERIVRDKKESLLSLSVKAYGEPRYIKTVSRGSFSPPPAVDSAIIAVTDISKNRFKTLSEPFFFSLLHLGFAAKRKQLLGNLAKKYDRGTLEKIFSDCNIPLAARGEDLSIETWFALVHMMQKEL